MNFLLQKEDNKSETKYAWDKGKNGWFLIFAGNVFISHFPSEWSEPEYRLSTKM